MFKQELKKIYPFDTYLMLDSNWTLSQLYTVIEFMYMFPVIDVDRSEIQLYDTLL